LLLGSLALACGLLQAATLAQGQPRNAPVVQTAEGAVRGIVKDDVGVYLGIPFASPPVGNLRWRPPEPVKRWSGTRAATHFGNSCPQVTTLGPYAGPPSVDEDCLYLNVFTTGTKGRKPVIVWVHGGGNFTGASTDYDGSKLAAGGPDGVESVVVTFNYRLGLLGYISHPALNAEGHTWGNYGFLDQVAALEWVKRNIANFGGDPDRITVGGQSAGSYNAIATVLSPTSRGKGLAHRVIVQSSPAFSSAWPTADATLRKGVAFAEAAGCPGTAAATAQCLRALTPARILQVQGTPAFPGLYTTGRPFVDGTVIPVQPQAAWDSGQFDRVPILAGGTRDEYSFFAGIRQYFSAWGGLQRPMSATDYADETKPGAFCQWCKDLKMPADVAAKYPPADYGGDPMIAYERIVTDVARCQEVKLVEQWSAQVPTYAYDYAYTGAPFYFPRMNGFKPLASHTADSQFIFKNYHGGQLGVNVDPTTGQPRELNAAESRLSDQIVGAYTRFAAAGNPNASGDQPWPRFTPGGSGRYLVQDISLSTSSASELRTRYKCDYWDANQ
jgi:para-nitrobenzyl esterase